MSADEVWGGKVLQIESRPYEPFDSIKRGDVIDWNGHMRTVRLIKRTATDHVNVVGFAKLRRSGYRYPWTLYWRSEIRTHFRGIVAHRTDPALCSTDIECRMQKEMDAGRLTPADELDVTESDTVGVIW